ncbi:beta-3 adrenergic receptor [Biomphalaria glabrata]|nr:beta-3 adrenergic receptor-like [Biomphalaria glabrata]
MNNSSCFIYEDDNHIILISFISLITFFTIASNCVLFVGLARSLIQSGKSNISKLYSNQSLTKLIMTSFVAVEIVVGALLMPLFVVEMTNDGKWKLGQLACTIRNFFSGCTCQLSISHICCMAVDRFLAIKHPLFYRRLTMRHALVQVGLAWLIPLITMMAFRLMDWYKDEQDLFNCAESHKICTMAFNNVFFYVTFPLFFVFPFLLAITLYIVILMEVQNFHIRTARFKRHGQPKCLRTNMNNNAASFDVQSHTGNARKTSLTSDAETNANNPDVLRNVSRGVQKPDRKNLKAYKTIGCIIMCILACWIPPFILSSTYVSEIRLVPLSVQLRLLFIFYLNASINPLIYMFNTSIRQAVKNLCFS